jgi:hypothetical protein
VAEDQRKRKQNIAPAKPVAAPRALKSKTNSRKSVAKIAAIVAKEKVMSSKAPAETNVALPHPTPTYPVTTPAYLSNRGTHPAMYASPMPMTAPSYPYSTGSASPSSAVLGAYAAFYRGCTFILSLSLALTGI